MWNFLRKSSDAAVDPRDARIKDLEEDNRFLLDRAKTAEALLEARNVQNAALEQINADQSSQNQKLFQANMNLAKGIPANARAVLEVMSDEWGRSVAQVSAFSSVADKDVRKIIRGFEAYGWAFRHPFVSEDDNLLHGSGYSLTKEGCEIRDALFVRPTSATQVSA